MKILVTGATGFIGSNLVNVLKKSRHHVKALVRRKILRAREFPWFHDGCVDIVHGDITNIEEVKKAVQDTDVVFHLAALLGHWGISESDYLRINVRGTRILIDECIKAGVYHFILLSTTGVMGRLKIIPADVSHNCTPISYYEKSKYQAELEVKKAIFRKNFLATVLRSTHVYGPGDKNTIKLFKAIRLFKMFPLIDGGQNSFQPIHVKDVVQALISSSSKHDATAGKTYIIAGNETITFKEFIHMSAKILGVRLTTLDIPTWLAEAISNFNDSMVSIINRELPLTRSRVEFFRRNHVYNTKKIQEDVGFTAKVDLKTGLCETINWYKENGWL